MRLLTRTMMVLALLAATGFAQDSDAEETLTVSKVLLPEESAGQAFCVSLTEDGKLMAFHSTRSGGLGKADIWLSRRENGRWSKPDNAGPGINSSLNEVDGRLSPDGSLMVFIRADHRPIKESSQILVSHLRGANWSPGKPIGVPVSPAGTIELAPILSRDGKRLYFSSNRKGGYGGYDFYYSDRIGERWSEPMNLGPVLNTPKDEIDLTLSRDGKAIIFPARREDSISGSRDLYVSRRVNDQWSPARNLGPRINTPGDDTCPWLTDDGQSLYLNSDWNGFVDGAKGPRLVWRFCYSEGF